MALIACSNSARAEKYLDKLPLSEIEFLNQATEVEVYAIPPHPKSQDPQGIAGYPILAKAQLRSSEARKILIAALSNAIRLGGPMMLCFDPHHAIRFAKNGEAHDFVICFECGEARELISRAGQPVEEISYGVSVMYAEPFNTILEATAPKFRENSNLFTIFKNSGLDFKPGEELNTRRLWKFDKFRDEYSKDFIETIDFARHPKSVGLIKQDETIKKGDVKYSDSP